MRRRGGSLAVTLRTRGTCYDLGAGVDEICFPAPAGLDLRRRPVRDGYTDFYIFLIPLYSLSLGMSAGEIGALVGGRSLLAVFLSVHIGSFAAIEVTSGLGSLLAGRAIRLGDRSALC
jgi:hypothetical protein